VLQITKSIQINKSIQHQKANNVHTYGTHAHTIQYISHKQARCGENVLVALHLIADLANIAMIIQSLMGQETSKKHVLNGNALICNIRVLLTMSRQNQPGIGLSESSLTTKLLFRLH